MPSYSILTLTDFEATKVVEALGRVRMDTSNQLLDDLLRDVQARITDGRYVYDRDAEARKTMLRGMLEDGMTQGEVLDVLHERGTEKEGVSSAKAIEAARDNFAEDNVNVDSNAIFSASDDGLWVQGWVFVTNDDLGLTDLPERFEGKLWHVDLRAQPAHQAVLVESMGEAIDLHDDIQDQETIGGRSERLVACATPEEAVALTKLSFDEGGVPRPTVCWQDSDTPGYGFEFIATDPEFLPAQPAEQE